MEQLRT